MPQANDELRAKFPDSHEAMNFLFDHGFTLNENTSVWSSPIGHKLTDDEWDAIDYLFHEWDFGYAGER